MKTTVAALLFLCAVGTIFAEELRFRGLLSGRDAVYGIKKKMGTPEIVMARNGKEFARLVAEDLTGSHGDMSGFPSVKWKTECAVAIFIGTRPSAGYAVRVQKVVRRGSAIEVTVKEQKPAPGDLAAQVITSPYTVIACNCKGIHLKEILMLKLIDPNGRTLVERPAWSYRLMQSSPPAETKKGSE
jgi:hypothetical protein